VARKAPLYDVFAAFLREVLVKVFIANWSAEGKDSKTELVYNYPTGGEFSSRIRYVLESYDEMARQLDAEKKQAQKRWAAQEKIIRKVTNSLYGMSGDMQGIAGKEINRASLTRRRRRKYSRENTGGRNA
jgi:hypothetical protein